MTHLHALSRHPSTFGAGTPLHIHPSRSRVALDIIAPPPEWLAIIDEVCARNQVHRRDVMNGWKVGRAVQCRNEIWSRIRATGASFEKIGMMTGGFHHTTVMHGVRQWAARDQKEAA